jgi:multiple sugar transport system substrate-binding protein
MQWVLDLKDRHAVTQPTPTPDGEGNPQALFQTGKAAMFHGFTTYLASMVNTIGSNFRYGVAPMPVGKQEACYGGANFFGIMRDSKQPDVSWTFLKHAVGPESFATYMQNGFVYVPVLKDRRAKEAFTRYGTNGSDRLLKQAAKSVTEQFVTPKIVDVRRAFNTHAGAIWRGEVGIRSGLGAAQSELQVIYDAG